MSRIIVDESLRAKLLNLTEPLELCAPTGEVLAHVTPVAEPWEPPIAEEELRRREQSTRWYTSEQVFERLKSLESQ